MNKQGFTLIELLAVLLILAVIAVITTPIITNVLSDSRQKTFKSSVEQLINIAKMDYNEYGRMDSITYTFDGDDFVCTGCNNGHDLDLDYSGDLDASGEIVYTNGEITSLNIKSDEFTASYNNGVKVVKN